MPQVSVIIPAYNQAKYLGAAIQSVLDQVFRDFDLCVVDDGSTDNTAQVAQSFQDPRLRYIYQPNRGLSAARNTGLRNTTGELVTFLDSDDLYSPEKLSVLVDVFSNHKEYGLVAGQAVPIDENGNQVGKIFDRPIPLESQNLLLGNPLHVGSVMIRRSWQERVGYFDETLRSYEDWDMWLRLALANCKMGWVPRQVSMYRFHTAQMTRIGSQMTGATFAVLDKVFHLPNLPSNWRALHDQAYSHAHLRAAAQSYLAQDFEQAREHLRQAIDFNPHLLDGDARRLADHFYSWTESPKVQNPFRFLEGIFDHLPDEIGVLRRDRRRHLGQAALQMAFQAYMYGDYKTTRSAVIHAFLYQPQCMMNRGAVSILLRSSFR